MNEAFHVGPRSERAARTVEDALVLDRIMSSSDYAKLGAVRWPYTYELRAGAKQLSYFGVSHPENNPDDPEYAQLEAAFAEADPQIVFIEGIQVDNPAAFSEKIKGMSRDEVIRRYTESGLVIKLAVEKGIEWRCPEPAGHEQYHYLEQRFNRDAIFAWYVLRHLSQYHKTQPKRGFKNYIQIYIDRFKEATRWGEEGAEFDYSYEHALEAAQEITGETIEVEETRGASRYVDPIPWEGEEATYTALNKINDVLREFRDRTIVTDIGQSLTSHDRLFIVYGGSHAVMQEPALRALLSEQERGAASAKS